MKIHLFILLVSLILLSACNDNSTESVSTGIPIVEAYLKVGEPVSVKISTIIPYGSDDMTGTDVNSLSVTVTTDNSTHQLAPLGDGMYVDSSLFVGENKEYMLTVNYNGILLTANTIVPAKPENFTQSVTEITVPVFEIGSGTLPEFPDPVKLTWTNTDGSYYVVVIENMEENPVAVNEQSNTDRPARTFRNQPSQNSSYEIQAMQFQYFGRHRLILHHLQPEYAALFEDNGDNSLNLKEPMTNIQNGLGIFTAVNSDTLFINVK
ncbi:MAG: DUF4249 family protein [Bacteroidota bacterium]